LFTLVEYLTGREMSIKNSSMQFNMQFKFEPHAVTLVVISFGHFQGDS
jgi:hypothetical protein